MDNLAHTLAGAALGQAGLRHRTRYGMATLLVGANLPDVDVVSTFADASLAFRRGWTHGVLAMVVLPVALAGLVVAWHRWVGGRRAPAAGAPGLRPGQLLLLAGIGVLSHPVLDWLNVYGIRLLMPFSDRWFYGDSLVIVDPWLWLVLCLGVLLSLRAGRRGRPRPERPARVALVVACGYLAGMIGLTQAGRLVVTAALDRDRVPGPRVLMVDPPFVQSHRRRVVLAAGGEYRFGEIDWFPRPTVVFHGAIAARTDDDPRVDGAVADRAARQLVAWARFPLFRVLESGSGAAILVDDARYARAGGPSWAAVIVPLPPR